MIHVVFLLAMAAASQEGILKEVTNEATCSAAMHMIQRSQTSKQATSSGDFFDFQKILADEPSGSFLSGMDVLVKANDWVYNTTKPLYDPQLDGLPGFEAGGRSWQRLRSYDLDPSLGGVFARVFLEPQSKSLLVAFKGVCMDPSLEQCKIDMCALKRAGAYGSLTPMMATTFGASDELCKKHASLVQSYSTQADALVRKLQADMPQYSITLTGHSLGGQMAIVTAARQPGKLKAMTFAPTPFHEILKEDLHLTEEEIKSLNKEELVATCDAFDCGINSVYAANARSGAKTCLYLEEEEPAPCSNLPQPYETRGWRKDLSSEVPDPGESIKKAIANLLCKNDAHNWLRYSQMVLRRENDGEPANLPVCSADYSVLENLQLRTGRVFWAKVLGGGFFLLEASSLSAKEFFFYKFLKWGVFETGDQRWEEPQ